jgi:SNF2 family DNA or RNA helicase
MQMVSELIAEGRKILLFSSFTSMLKLIEVALQEQSIDYVQLTGSTVDRETPIQRFQSGAVPIFLISLKAGGVGLNLTQADTVIHYDPWWNPAAERQATDRAHRLGQTKPVFVYKLVTVGTVEEKILVMQQKKRSLLEGLFEENATKNTSLTLEDLDFLFEPLEALARA